MPFLYDVQAMTYIGISFWLFVAIVVVAALWYYKSRNAEKQKTIRLAIEKGVELKPEVIEALDKPKPVRPEDYSIGGYICLPIGLGLIIFAFFLAKISPQALWPLAGAGVLTMCVGGGLLMTAAMIRRWNSRRAGN